MITMFRKIRRPLLGLAVIASSIVVVPIAASVVNASDGTMDNTTWGAAGGGRVLINTEFTEPGGNVRFTATAGFLMARFFSLVTPAQRAQIVSGSQLSFLPTTAIH